MKNIQYKGIDVCYETYGQSSKPCIVLIHGYLESHKIYEELVRELQDQFYFIVPDLPGHGRSGVYSENHSLDEMAEAVNIVIDRCGIGRVHLVGHSMGGYVAMAFRDLFPEKLVSYSLLNSHCYSDSDEKKEARQREIEMIRAGKKDLIVRTNIPRIYANDNLEIMKDAVGKSMSLAMETADEGIIALLNGMKDRADRSGLIKEGGVKSYLFVGLKDNLIPVEIADKIMETAKDMERFDLHNSGHMCFVEEQQRVAEIFLQIFGE